MWAACCSCHGRMCLKRYVESAAAATAHLRHTSCCFSTALILGTVMPQQFHCGPADTCLLACCCMCVYVPADEAQVLSDHLSSSAVPAAAAPTAATPAAPCRRHAGRFPVDDLPSSSRCRGCCRPPGEQGSQAGGYSSSDGCHAGFGPWTPARLCITRTVFRAGQAVACFRCV